MTPPNPDRAENALGIYLLHSLRHLGFYSLSDGIIIKERYQSSFTKIPLKTTMLRRNSMLYLFKPGADVVFPYLIVWGHHILISQVVVLRMSGVRRVFGSVLLCETW